MTASSATKSIAKNFSWLVVGNTLGGLFNFLTIVYIARVLGASTFGLYQFALAILTYLAIAVDCGLSTFGIRKIAREPERAVQITSHILIIRLVSSFVCFFSSLLIIAFVPVPQDIRVLFLWVFLLVFYRALNLDWVWQGMEKMEFMALSRFLFPAVVFGMIVWLVKSPADLTLVFIIQFFVGMIISLGFIFVFYKKHWAITELKIDSAVWKKYLFQAIPLGASSILVMVYNNIDTVMLGMMDKMDVVGYYTSAYQLFYVFVGFLGIWQTTAVPVITRKLKEDANRAKIFMEKYLRLTMLGVVPLVVFAFLAAQSLLPFVYGQHYLPAVIAFKILIWTLGIMVFGTMYASMVLVSAGHYYSFFLVVALGAAANILANLFLIPRFGYAGAAVSTIIAESLVALAALYLSRKIFSLNFIKPIIKPVVFAIIAAGLCSFFAKYVLSGSSYLFFALQAFIFLIAYLAMALITEKSFIAGFIREIFGGKTAN